MQGRIQGGEWGETPPQDLWSVGKFHELGQNVTVKFRLRAKKKVHGLGNILGKFLQVGKFSKKFSKLQISEKNF